MNRGNRSTAVLVLALGYVHNGYSNPYRTILLESRGGRVGKADEEKRGRCQLCLEETELRGSHVLSEFLYELTYQRFDP